MNKKKFSKTLDTVIWAKVINQPVPWELLLEVTEKTDIEEMILCENPACIHPCFL